MARKDSFEWSRSVLNRTLYQWSMMLAARVANAYAFTQVTVEARRTEDYRRCTAYYKGMIEGSWSTWRTYKLDTEIIHAYLFRWYDEQDNVVREEWIDMDEYATRIVGRSNPDADLEYPWHTHQGAKLTGKGYMVDGSIVACWRNIPNMPPRPVLSRVCFVSDETAQITGLSATYPPIVEHKDVTYDVISLDVWGNALNGYEINDWHKTGRTITVRDDATDADILRALRKAGLTTNLVNARSFAVDDPSCERRTLTIVDNRQPRLVKSDETRVTHGHGRPLFELRLRE